MDIENTMIPSNMYQTWLQDSTDIVIKRPEIAKVSLPFPVNLAFLHTDDNDIQ